MTEHADLGAWLDDRRRSKRDDLVNRYQYLCRRGARKYSRTVEDRADFEQTAAVGLIKAVDRYREETGTPFEAYAWIFIQGELSHYVRDAERMMRPPRRLRALEQQWRVAHEELRWELNREPTESEIASALRLDLDAVRDLTEYLRRARIDSLDALPVDAAAGAYYTIDDEDDRLTIQEALRVLTPLERSIVLESIEADRSLVEIAQQLGYSQRHVSRVRRAAMKKLGPLCVASAPGVGY